MSAQISGVYSLSLDKCIQLYNLNPHQGGEHYYLSKQFPLLPSQLLYKLADDGIYVLVPGLFISSLQTETH